MKIAYFHQAILKLSQIDFSGRGEEFVGASFLTPLLILLGYEAGQDYDVLRDGDDGSSFQVRYPPVESGSKKVKRYRIDYIPTLRKKMFWIIEAKSPKDTSYPFKGEYLIQGFQYCVHPEIQAYYMMLTNGKYISIYAPHESVFFGKDFYQPILSFPTIDLPSRWQELHALLSPEKIREKLESHLENLFTKLSLSSIDEEYPGRLCEKISGLSDNLYYEIRNRRAKLECERHERILKMRRTLLEQTDTETLFDLLCFRHPPMGISPACILAERITQEKQEEKHLEYFFDKLNTGTIFEKVNTYIVLSHFCISSPVLNKDILKKLMSSLVLSEQNTVDCLLLRILSRELMLCSYRKEKDYMNLIRRVAPEKIEILGSYETMERINSLTESIFREVRERFLDLSLLPLPDIIADLRSIDQKLEPMFEDLRKDIRGEDREISPLFDFGECDGFHWELGNILINQNLMSKIEIIDYMLTKGLSLKRSEKTHGEIVLTLQKPYYVGSIYSQSKDLVKQYSFKLFFTLNKEQINIFIPD